MSFSSLHHGTLASTSCPTCPYVVIGSVSTVVSSYFTIVFLAAPAARGGTSTWRVSGTLSTNCTRTARCRSLMHKDTSCFFGHTMYLCCGDVPRSSSVTASSGGGMVGHGASAMMGAPAISRFCCSWGGFGRELRSNCHVDATASQSTASCSSLLTSFMQSDEEEHRSHSETNISPSQFCERAKKTSPGACGYIEFYAPSSHAFTFSGHTR